MIFLLLTGSPAGAVISVRDMPGYTEYDLWGVYDPIRIVIDHENQKWFMAPNALFMYDGVETTRFYTGRDIPRELTDIQVDMLGHVWLASNNGIAEWDGLEWTIYSTENSDLPSNQVMYIRFGPDGDLWLVTDRSISHYNGETWKNIECMQVLISGFEVDGENTVWLKYVRDVSRYDGTRWYDVNINDDVDSPRIRSMIKRPDGSMLLSTDTEAWSYAGGVWTQEIRDSLIRLTDFKLVDDLGRIWTDGLTCISGNTFAGISLSGIEDWVFDRDGYVWAVDNNRAYSFYPRFLEINEPRGNAWQGLSYEFHYYPGDQITITWLANCVDELSIAWSVDGYEWHTIAEHIDPESGKYDWQIPNDIIPEHMFMNTLQIEISPFPDFAENHINTYLTVVIPDFSSRLTYYPVMLDGPMYEDSSGNLWFISNNESLVKFDGNEFTTYHPGGDVALRRLNVAPDGCFWMTYYSSTETGILKFDGDEFTQWPFDVSQNSI